VLWNKRHMPGICIDQLVKVLMNLCPVRNGFVRRRNQESKKPLDPYLLPHTSFGNRLARFLWGIVYVLFFRLSPQPFHSWRSLLLKCFGAELGKNCHIYPKARIWAPWNLQCEDAVGIADEAIVYNPCSVFLGSHATVSQQAYLCGATHNIDDPAFPVLPGPIKIGRYAWICARATVMPNVTVSEGAVLGLGSVATSDLEEWSVYVGVPAQKRKERVRHCL